MIVSVLAHAPYIQAGQITADCPIKGAPVADEERSLRGSACMNGEALEQIVVTGSAESRGVSQLSASYSIASISKVAILDAKPSNAADLLKIVPGIWAESGGGEQGANIEIAGFPGGGDSPYVSYQLNGSPLYPVPSLSFMDNSGLFRLDDSIDHAEVLLGGPSVLWAGGQIGATANFLLREGAEFSRGGASLTVGSENLERLDGYLSGPIASQWYYSAAGFFRLSDGIRSPQFAADRGGQATLTISHRSEAASVMLYTRVLLDKNLFVTDVPVVVSEDGKHISAFPGFSPTNGTFASNALRYLTVQSSPGQPPGTVSADLANGRGAQTFTMGSDGAWHLAGWEVTNKAQFTEGSVPTTALFNNLAPTSVASFLSSEITAANQNENVVLAAGRLASAGVATLTQNGSDVALDTPVASVGAWLVDKRIRAFSDEMRVSIDLPLLNELTLGAYYAHYTSSDNWYLGNNLLVTAVANAQPVDVALDNGVQVTKDGVLSGPFYRLDAKFVGNTAAAILSDNQQLGVFEIDGGYRVENTRLTGLVHDSINVDLDGNPLTLYNNATNVETDGVARLQFERTANAWTLGCGYAIDPSLTLYSRLSEGFHMPSFDDLRDGASELQRVKSVELGVRGRWPIGNISLSTFYRHVAGVPYAEFLADGSEVIGSYGSVGRGVDLEARWQPLHRFSIDLTGSWQRSTYTQYFGGALSSDGLVDYSGSLLQRQPRIQFRLTPGYTFILGWAELRMFSTYSYVGLRFSNPGEQQLLPQYYTLDAGLALKGLHGWGLRVQGSNLTDQIGLTEGNARVLASGISHGFEMARPIFGREVQMKLEYEF